MGDVGIEAMNVFGGSVYLDVMQLAKHRQLDTTRFENLLMKEKAVALPYEDPVTYGVNAAKPLLDSLSDAEKDRRAHQVIQWRDRPARRSFSRAHETRELGDIARDTCVLRVLHGIATRISNTLACIWFRFLRH